MNQLLGYLERILREHGNVKHVQLLRAWPDIMGNLHKRTRLESFQDGQVIIGVYDPQWLQELHFLKSVIKQHINEYFQASVVSDIQFRRVGRRKKNASFQPVVQQEPPQRTPVSLSKKEKHALEHITDETLREALYRFYCNRD